MFMGQRSSVLNDPTAKEEQSLAVWQYDETQSTWSQKSRNENLSASQCENFRVLSYNIWFANEFQPMRFNSLCEILDQSQAQIIGLQEVTKNILQRLLAQPFIQKRYYLTDTDGRTFNGWYGVALLIDIRLHVSNLALIDFPQSTMGRRLVFAEILLNKNEVLRIGTVHLESLNNQAERSRELEICQRALNHFPGSSILMGDFNFGAQAQENVDQFKRLPLWIDVWAQLMDAHNLGYTFDTETNSMMKIQGVGVEQARYDRIILRTQTLIPLEIKIIGTQPIGKYGQFDIFTSDHFGLTADFRISK